MTERHRCDCGCGRFTRLAPYTHKERGWVKGAPIRYIHGHHARLLTPEYLEEDRGYKTPCWVWQRALMRPRGYGTLTVSGKSKMAHRVYYERKKGPIPQGLHIDHLCGITACVNPDHLEAVTCRENLRRGRSTHLTLEEVRTLVLRRLDGERAVDLAEEFGINPSTVASLSRGAEAVLRR